jgi:phosphatidylserine/phosphatidylglycerophosphate/cardiolipin synthase-like enzyme
MKHPEIAATLLLTSMLSVPLTLFAEMVVQTCFSPQGKCSAHILREIEAAKQELLIAVYAFTSDDLAGALVQAKKRGVAVQVVIDREFDRTNDNSKGKFFDTQKIAVRRVSGAASKLGDKEPGLMHQKFAVIDRRIVLTGSYNWTYSADNRNDENLLMFRDASPLAEEYRKTFLQLWERKP